VTPRRRYLLAALLCGAAVLTSCATSPSQSDPSAQALASLAALNDSYRDTVREIGVAHGAKELEDKPFVTLMQIAERTEAALRSLSAAIDIYAATGSTPALGRMLEAQADAEIALGKLVSAWLAVKPKGGSR